MTRRGVTDSAHAHEVAPVCFPGMRSISPRMLVTSHIIKVTGGNHHIITLEAVCNMADNGNDVVIPSSGKHKRKRIECPLCSGLDMAIEHAGGAPCDNQAMRQVMAIELKSFGTIPDGIIYAKIARAYNERVYAPTVAAGFSVCRWTTRMVRIHFEQHVTLVPRRVVGKDLARCEKMLRVVDNEMKAQNLAAVDPTDQLESKTMAKAITIMKMKQTLLKDLRAYMREDMAATGGELLSSRGNAAVVGDDAKEILITLHNSANGAGVFTPAPNAGDDMPAGSEIF